MTFKDQRDLDRLPAEIARIDAAITLAESVLHDPDLYLKSHDKFAALTKQIEKLNAEKDTAELRWLEVAELAEGLGA